MMAPSGTYASTPVRMQYVPVNWRGRSRPLRGTAWGPWSRGGEKRSVGAGLLAEVAGGGDGEAPGPDVVVVSAVDVAAGEGVVIDGAGEGEAADGGLVELLGLAHIEGHLSIGGGTGSRQWSGRGPLLHLSLMLSFGMPP